MIYLTLIAALFASGFSTEYKHSGLYASTYALPWATPINRCTKSIEGRRRTSMKLECETICDDNGDCTRSLIRRTYWGAKCNSERIARNDTIICDGQSTSCQCYEENELPGYDGPEDVEYVTNHAVISLRRALGEPEEPAYFARNRDNEIPNTIEDIEKDTLSVIDQKSQMLPICRKDRSRKSIFEIAVVTETCFYYNWAAARQAFEDDPFDEVDEPDLNKTLLFDLAFPNDVFWYKIECGSRGQLYWDQYSDPDCTVPIPTATPLILNKGCKDWAIFGNYWRAKIKCTGNSYRKRRSNSQTRAFPALAAVLVVSFALLAQIWQ